MPKRPYSLYLLIYLCFYWVSADSAQIARYNVAEKSWLDSHQVLRVGVVEWTPPILFYAGGSQPKGLVADYLRALAMHLGLQLEIKRFPNESALATALASAEVDVVGAVATGLDGNRSWICTRPYLSLPVALFSNQELSSRGLTELRGKTVAVVSGSVWDQGLTTLVPGVKVNDFPTLEQALQAVSENRALAYLGDVASAAYLLQQTEIGDIEEQVRTTLTYDISLATPQRYPELQSLIQKGIDRITSEELQAIWLRWPRVERPDNFQDPIPTWVLMLPLLIAWTLFVGWAVRRYTRQQQIHRHGRLKQTIRRLQRRERHLKEKLLRLKRKALSYRKDSRRHRRQLGLLQDVMPNAAWVWDPSVGRCQWDEGMYGFFRAEEEAFEPTPQAILDRVHSEDRDKVSALFSAQEENGELQMSYRILLPDGQIRWVLDYSHGHIEEGVQQRVGICWDISGYQLDSDHGS
ncbi:MAG: transporter substrate-binding domain-containing protein [Candidatus Thiodiazotropha sp. (ex Monitilora ramsayi)]|nr:transporter substrate-binding domain-containing protein [Candidatus Thiodiazotropha sp. (ex Monitilora ramsayi)]